MIDVELEVNNLRTGTGDVDHVVGAAVDLCWPAPAYDIVRFGTELESAIPLSLYGSPEGPEMETRERRHLLPCCLPSSLCSSMMSLVCPTTHPVIL